MRDKIIIAVATATLGAVLPFATLWYDDAHVQAELSLQEQQAESQMRLQVINGNNPHRSHNPVEGPTR